MTWLHIPLPWLHCWAGSSGSGLGWMAEGIECAIYTFLQLLIWLNAAFIDCMLLTWQQARLLPFTATSKADAVAAVLSQAARDLQALMG